MTEYVLDAVPPMSPVTVTVSGNVPAAVGMPRIVPVEASIDRPVGNLVADHSYGAVPPLAVGVNGG